MAKQSQILWVEATLQEICVSQLYQRWKFIGHSRLILGVFERNSYCNILQIHYKTPQNISSEVLLITKHAWQLYGINFSSIHQTSHIHTILIMPLGPTELQKNRNIETEIGPSPTSPLIYLIFIIHSHLPSIGWYDLVIFRMLDQVASFSAVSVCSSWQRWLAS